MPVVERRRAEAGLWRLLPGSPLARAAVLTVLVATALYLRTWGHGFAWDDLSILMANDSLSDWSQLGANLAPGFFHEPSGGVLADYWRPLVVLSHMIDRALFGEAAWGPHVVNTLLHAATSLLALLVCHAWTRDVRWALAAGLLFAVHPVHVEVVAWVSGRSDLLLGLFSALTLLADSLHGRTGRRRWQVLALASFALALLSKEAAIVLPTLVAARALLAPEDWAARRRRLAGAVAAAAPFVALALALLAVRFGLLGATLPAAGPTPTRALLFWTWWSACRLYLELLLWPRHLTILHQVDIVRTALDWRPWAGALGLLGLLTIGWRLRRRAPGAAFGVAILTLGLAPLTNVVLPVSRQAGAEFPAAERFLYAPSLGFCLFAAWALARWLPDRLEALARRRAAGADTEPAAWPRRAGVIALLGLVLALAARSDLRSRDWASDLTLFAAAVRESPASYLAHLNYASALAQAAVEGDSDLRGQRLEGARRHYLAAAARAPDNFRIPYDLGNLLVSSGRVEEAEAAYRRALELAPDLAQARLNLGALLVRKGDLSGALEQFAAADRQSPELTAAKVNRAHVLQMLGRPAEAIPLYQQALAREPGLPAAVDGLRRAKAAVAAGLR